MGVTGSVGLTERGNKGGQRGVVVSAAQDDKDRTGKCATTAMGTAAVNAGGARCKSSHTYNWHSKQWLL